MKRILLNEFKEYENMKKKDLEKNIGNFSPTVVLPLIYNEKVDFKKIESIRKIRPDIAISTDIIVGFPEETDDDFKETLEFLLGESEKVKLICSLIDN
jgi:radical SAM superfamily enzyme YgiQ (UPF0313 family)